MNKAVLDQALDSAVNLVHLPLSAAQLAELVAGRVVRVDAAPEVAGGEPTVIIIRLKRAAPGPAVGAAWQQMRTVYDANIAAGDDAVVTAVGDQVQVYAALAGMPEADVWASLDNKATEPPFHPFADAIGAP